MGPVKKSAASTTRKPGAKKDRARRPSLSPAPRLRCPFDANSPDKFRGYNSSCQGNGFENPARVVEHLKRTHGPVELRDNVADLDATDTPDFPQATAPNHDHSQVDGLFEPSGGVPGQEATASGSQEASADYEIERVTQEQLNLIANLPRSSNVQEKWESIYHIIFPDDEAVKPAYMPSVDRLRDHANNPPPWLITGMMVAIGASRQEIFIMMQNFLVFFDLVGGNHSSLAASMLSPAPTQRGQSSTGSEIHLGGSIMGDFPSPASMNSQPPLQLVRPSVGPQIVLENYTITGPSLSGPMMSLQLDQPVQPTMGHEGLVGNPYMGGMANNHGFDTWPPGTSNLNSTDRNTGDIDMFD